MVAYSIYVVDDDADMREVLSLALESKFQVKAFSTAGSAIEVIKDEPPDLILLDIGLPDMRTASKYLSRTCSSGP